MSQIYPMVNDYAANPAPADVSLRALCCSPWLPVRVVSVSRGGSFRKELFGLDGLSRGLEGLQPERGHMALQRLGQGLK